MDAHSTQPPEERGTTPTAPSTPTSQPPLTLNTSLQGSPTAVPNKHLPICSPGPVPVQKPESPPSSPPTHDAVLANSSITYPPGVHCTLYEDNPPVYVMGADKLMLALEHLSTKPLPNTSQVFPWLHGLHADNVLQCTFFTSRRSALRKTPKCIRGLTIVKTDGDLSSSRLKGAISPDEILMPNADVFIECDPKDGFSVRNFQIQACKLAMVSDIVVYGNDLAPLQYTLDLARRISRAQRQFEARNGLKQGTFNTFMLQDPFDHVLTTYPSVVAIDASGEPTGNVVDFFFWERYEMSFMSRSSGISHNVYLGPTPDHEGGHLPFDVLIEAADGVRGPDSRALDRFRDALRSPLRSPTRSPLLLQFPSSGSIPTSNYTQADVDGLLDMVQFIYEMANPRSANQAHRVTPDEDEAIALVDLPVARKFLIHCTDGYTETSLLGLAYYMYAEGVPAHEAWIQMHRDRGRNFFAYPADVDFLTTIQAHILHHSPMYSNNGPIYQPRWMARLDGSLPSRILPYMYLGNLPHANNPEMLRELGITRILSIGEQLSWSEDLRRSLKWPAENLMMVDQVQDNGIDPLWNEFERCLKFIEAGKKDGGATLVHCRVGVSRSATICIAEVMNEKGLSFPRAYCFVRARRLNVIIQPHLRFTYELLKWEEHQCVRRNKPVRRAHEWATVAREIALMNKPYSR